MSTAGADAFIAEIYAMTPWRKTTDLARAIHQGLPEDERLAVRTIRRRLDLLRLAAGKTIDDSRRERILELLEHNPLIVDAEIRAELGLTSHDGCRPMIRAAREEAGAPNRIDRMKIVRQAVLDWIAEQSDPVTSRQAAYALSARGFIDKNEPAFAGLARLLVDMRRKREIPWSAIEDRTRHVDFPPARIMKAPPDREEIADAFVAELYGIADPEDIIRHAVQDVRRLFNEAANPPEWSMIEGPRPVVLIEKDALFPAVRDEAHRLNTPVISTRGFSSVTQLGDLAAALDEDTAVMHGHVLLWLHDWDTSGERMENASVRTLEEDFGQHNVSVRHVALTEAQVAEWHIQTRPDKQTAGREAAELDAIPPEDFRRLVREAIQDYIPDDHADRAREYVREVNREADRLIDRFVYEVNDEDGMSYYSRRIAFLVDRDNDGAQREEELDEGGLLGRRFEVLQGLTIADWRNAPVGQNRH